MLLRSLLSTLLAICSISPLQAQEDENHNEAKPLPEKSFQDHFAQISKEPGAALFTPPAEWRLADSKLLPPSVKAMVIGKGEYEYPPSLNLGMEKFDGTLKDYLKIVKTLNQAQGYQWKDLGKIKTEAGNASLSQVELNTEWGMVKMMHVIFVKSGTAYILTAASRKEEFPKFYKDFFDSLRSFKINKDAFEMVDSSEKRTKLQELYNQTKEKGIVYIKEHTTQEISEKQVFETEDFQKQVWGALKSALLEEYATMGSDWEVFLLNKLRQEILFQSNVAQK